MSDSLSKTTPEGPAEVEGAKESEGGGKKVAKLSSKNKVTNECKSRTLMTLVLLFFCLAAVNFGFFLMYFFKYENAVEEINALKREKKGASHDLAGREPMLDTASVSGTLTSSSNSLCTSRDCFQKVSEIAMKMDRMVSPCEDFDEFACGNFYRDMGFLDATSFHSIIYNNMKLQRTILKESIKKTDRSYIKNMKALYRSCMDTDTIDEVGLQPYLESVFAKEWPTLLGDSWLGQDFDLPKLVTRYASEQTFPLFNFAIMGDMKNSSSHSLYLTEPELFLPRDVFLRDRNDSLIRAVQQYLTNMAVELGAKTSVAASDAADLVDLKIKLARITTPNVKHGEMNDMYNPITLETMGPNYTFFGVPEATQNAFRMANMSLGDSQRVIIISPDYMDKLRDLYDSLDTSKRKRTFQNLFGFTYARAKTSDLTKRMREISAEMSRIYRNRQRTKPAALRMHKCSDLAIQTFSLGMAKEFAARTSTESTKTFINTMIDNLDSAFEELLHEATWMGSRTRTAAFEKLKSMKRKIGYPDKNFDEEYLEKRYKKLIMTKDKYFENKQIIFRDSAIRYLKKLTEPVDKSVWSQTIYEANARYEPLHNAITIPIGILRTPVFSETYLTLTNYASIGFIIGHELTHGFDNIGSQFDKDGKLSDWWEEEDRAKFKNKTRCLVDQFSQFRDERVHLNVNGLNVQAEAIADSGGLKISYMAYKELTRDDDELSALPGLSGLTSDQLFFLSYAQVFCHHTSSAYASKRIGVAPHPFGRYRILGTLRNSAEFAKAYNCPEGSPMNPAEKCSLW